MAGGRDANSWRWTSRLLHDSFKEKSGGGSLQARLFAAQHLREDFLIHVAAGGDEGYAVAFERW